MFGRILAVAIGALTPAAAWAEDGLPQGWRTATAAERSQNVEMARQHGGPAKQVLAVTADFDGDGRKDQAAILVNATTERFAVFVRRASLGRYVEVASGEHRSGLWNYTLDLLQPGVREPACARGIDTGGGACPKSVRNRWPAISLVSFESSEQIIYWDGRGFASEFLTD